MNSSTLTQKFKDAGQGHVFRFYTKLDEAEKSVLLEQAAEIDLAEISFLSREWQQIGSSAEDFTGLTPAPYVQHPTSGGNKELWATSSTLGEEALRKGRVAAFTVAGGQGTRRREHSPPLPLRANHCFRYLLKKSGHPVTGTDSLSNGLS
jgi:UDP-N-acetylglucosamine/UDP-N-acetylgalactosamine diphosphorylase